jgi:hypothetical protein
VYFVSSGVYMDSPYRDRKLSVSLWRVLRAPLHLKVDEVMAHSPLNLVKADS